MEAEERLLVLAVAAEHLLAERDWECRETDEARQLLRLILLDDLVLTLLGGGGGWKRR